MMRYAIPASVLLMFVAGCTGDDDCQANDAGMCIDSEDSPEGKAGGGANKPLRPGVVQLDPDDGEGGDGEAGDDEGGTGGRNSGSGGSGGSGGSSGGTDTGEGYGDAVAELYDELCGCLEMDIDSCTLTTADQRSCEAEAAAAATGAAAEWLGCVTDFLDGQTSCIAASQCDEAALSECDLIADQSDDPFAAACGEPPQAVSDAVVECTPEGGGPTCSVDPSWICDYEVDCPDGSDEVDCPPPFMCDGEALPPGWVCDGEADCSDGSDEEDC
jgi:hypothetical protein